jgi:Protein of unknown function (DUF998)
VVVAWLHAVRTDIDPFRRGVSRYAAGPYGFAVSVAFATLALALLIAASQLGSAAEDPGMGRYRRSLWVGAVGLLAVVVFPLRSSSPGTSEYWVHQLGGGIFFLAATVGIQAITTRLQRTEAPEWLTILARASGRASAMLLPLFFSSVAMNIAALNSVLGILQRACFVTLCTSLITLGIGLLKERRPVTTACSRRRLVES